MYRKKPEIKAKQIWHDLLNNGNRFALVDDKNKIYAASCDFWKLEHSLKLRPTLNLKIIVITDILDEMESMTEIIKYAIA